MASEEADSNPVAAVQKPLLEPLFPVRRVLGMLQRNERLSEQPTQLLPNTRDENQDANTQERSPTITTPSEEFVSESPPSQPGEDSQESIPTKGEGVTLLMCPKCGKTFTTGTLLRTHLANVYPCDQPRPSAMSKDGKMEAKTCFKCGKTFASWQGLRGHLNRIKPCDQEKPATTTTTRRRPAASRTCNKCGKTFSSPQSLRIHMNRVKPCDQDKNAVPSPTTPPGASPQTTSLTMNAEDVKKEAERKAKARYQARKAYLKKRGRLGELGDPPTTLYPSGEDRKGAEEAAPKPDLKRSVPDIPSNEDGDGELSNVEVKKPRVQEECVSGDSPSDVSGLTPPSIPTPPQGTSPKKKVVNEGRFVHRSNQDHGGDLLAGGCSCPPCVRRWARKLMNRMQQLEDEVMTLRQKKSTEGEMGADSVVTADATKTPTPPSQEKSVTPTQSETPDLGRSLPSVTSKVGVADLSQAKAADIFRSLANSSNAMVTSQRPQSYVSGAVNKPYSSISPRTYGQSTHNGDLLLTYPGQHQPNPITAAIQGLGSDKRSLMDAYSHMNDQILLNERTVEESSSHIQILVGYDEATASDFRKQVDELRESITAEKSKRDITVAALIVHEWKPRHGEFKEVLEIPELQNSPNDEQRYHAKWADIANQVSTKDKTMAELERRMDSLGQSGGSSRSRYAEMGELSSKVAAEYAAKMALESEREGVYLGLVKSSSRIRSLVRNAVCM